MRPAALTGLLASAPPGADEALELTDRLDAVLTDGLARPGAEGARALEDLAAATGSSPLAAPVREAASAMGSGPVGAACLAALAGARTALTGAVHDALLAALDTALGRTREEADAPAAPAPAPAPELEGARSWLAELAMAGWRGVDRDLAAGADAALTPLLEDPARRRLAVLLDGLGAELRAHCPLPGDQDPPARRWSDLWARAVLLAQDAFPVWPGAPARQATGRLLPLGADVHQHPTAFQVQVHALLEPSDGGPVRLVRTSVSALKVDVLTRESVWGLLAEHTVLLRALAEHRALDVEGMPLLEGGDLLWDEGRAALGGPADRFAAARLHLAGAAAPAVPALERHPARIAEPVLLEGYTAKKRTRPAPGLELDLDGARLPVSLLRRPDSSSLDMKAAASSGACLGLMRWDAGQWSVQMLGVAAKKAPAEQTHTGDWALGPTDPKFATALRNSDPLGTLRERAGKLLRK
ncbi:hypothetical protein [Nocardiopsis suaedae]|uniref:SWIM zinc finger family protein n=1 Tax=Nocardiopsis suaedae TaxID=3018444 RepID=A0ABT4TKV2_9ACTN|nr:hypothetical protein [Nocardiopsis suaedae]MDA2805337.1 hypothetical protein [Nocardiopsis suaedae]